jgi:NADPH-dependent 2,4-dienoyl-CoA reductase/sulfur reductase-like enzyme
MAERLVVVGGDAAGMSAASQARRRRDVDDLEILVFEKGPYTSYSACGIPYFLGGIVEDANTLIVRNPDEFRDKYAIDARVGHEVTEIDLDARKVTVRTNDGEELVPFDQLVMATGGRPLRPQLENVDADGIFGVQVLADGFAVDAFLKEESSRKAVIVGTGYIGLEMAEALSARGLDVVTVDRLPQPMGGLDPDMGALVADALSEVGTEVFLGETVTGFEKRDGRVSAVVTDQRTLPADIVILGLGVRPNSDLARDAGVPLGPSGAIAVDRQMRTQVDGVWAAGDCAEKFHRVSRNPVAIALGTHANKEGRVAGINIGGGYAAFPGVIGTAVTKVCKVEVGRTGLKESEARQAGYDHLAVVVDSTTRAGYFPGTAPIKTKLIVERRTGLLLGAQIVGREGAAKRIDVLATAIWNEMSVAELLNIDLSYAPPFSPVWDPVLIAARKAWQLVEETAQESM